KATGRIPWKERSGARGSARKRDSGAWRKEDSRRIAASPCEVPETGLEPARSCDHQALNLARLPIPPLRRFANSALDSLNVGGGASGNQGSIRRANVDAKAAAAKCLSQSALSSNAQAQRELPQ